MKKVWNAVSGLMIATGLILAGAQHPDATVQFIVCISGVFLVGGGGSILTVINS